jgi:hypothetical protein
VSARAPSSVEAPEAPPVHALDGTLPSEGFLFLGANATHAWFTSVASDSDPRYSVVVDLARGCAVESYPEPKAIGVLRGVNAGRVTGNVAQARSAPDLLASADTRADLRGVIGLARRFDLTYLKNDQVVWSKDGHHVFVVDGRLHHSADGGKSYEVLDEAEVYSPAVTPDGKYVVYMRCVGHDVKDGTLCPTARELVSWNIDGTSPPRKLDAGPELHFEGLSSDGHLILTHRPESSRFCVELADPGTAKIQRSVCTQIPASKVSREHGVTWQGASPGDRFGSIEWWGGTRKTGATVFLAITDMQDGHIVRTIEDFAIRGWDDNGTVLLSSMTEGATDRTFFERTGHPRKRLGNFVVHDFDPATRRAIVDAKPPRGSTLAKTACKIERVITIP